MILAFLRGLEKAPTFLVPIINPPFADNSPHLISGVASFPMEWIISPRPIPKNVSGAVLA